MKRKMKIIENIKVNNSSILLVIGFWVKPFRLLLLLCFLLALFSRALVLSMLGTENIDDLLLKIFGFLTQNIILFPKVGHFSS